MKPHMGQVSIRILCMLTHVFAHLKMRFFDPCQTLLRRPAFRDNQSKHVCVSVHHYEVNHAVQQGALAGGSDEPAVSCQEAAQEEFSDGAVSPLSDSSCPSTHVLFAHAHASHLLRSADESR